jgi:hypothetical protein
MFSVGRFDWKNLIGGDSLLKDLGRTRGGMLKPLVSGLLLHAVDDGAQGGDRLRLSRPLQLLQQGGVDLERSYVREESQLLEFSFSFQDEQIRSLSTGGVWDVRSQSLKMDYTFQSLVKTVDPFTGEDREEMFQFQFHLEASNFRMQGGSNEVRKEDILEFAQKILKKINKMRAEGTKIDALVLDKEDLRDFGAVEHGKLLKQISHLIDLMKSLDRVDGRRGHHELLHPERDQAKVADETRYEEFKMDFSLSMSRIESITSVEEGTVPAEMPADTPSAALTHRDGTASAQP